MGYNHGQKTRFHVNRTFGGDCYHSIIDGDIDAGTTAREETGTGSCLSVKPETMGSLLFDIHAR